MHNGTLRLRELAAVRVRFGYRRLTFLLKREGWNGKLRDECVNSRVLTSVVEAQVVLGAWRQDYNRVRPQPLAESNAGSGGCTVGRLT